jgi:hypothetical protein
MQPRTTQKYRKKDSWAFIWYQAEGDSTDGLPSWVATLPYGLRLLTGAILFMVCVGGPMVFLLWIPDVLFR